MEMHIQQLKTFVQCLLVLGTVAAYHPKQLFLFTQVVKFDNTLFQRGYFVTEKRSKALEDKNVAWCAELFGCQYMS